MPDTQGKNVLDDSNDGDTNRDRSPVNIRRKQTSLWKPPPDSLVEKVSSSSTLSTHYPPDRYFQNKRPGRADESDVVLDRKRRTHDDCHPGHRPYSSRKHHEDDPYGYDDHRHRHPRGNPSSTTSSSSSQYHHRERSSPPYRHSERYPGYRDRHSRSPSYSSSVASSRSRYYRNHDGHHYTDDNHHYHRGNDHDKKYYEHRPRKCDHPYIHDYDNDGNKDPFAKKSNQINMKNEHLYTPSHHTVVDPCDSLYKKYEKDVKHFFQGRKRTITEQQNDEQERKTLSSPPLPSTPPPPVHSPKGECKEKNTDKGQSVANNPREKTPSPKPICLGDLVPHMKDIDRKYEKICQIGEGTYGKVFKGRCLATGALVAMKKVRMESEKEGFPITATREIKLLLSMDHPNIVKLIEIVTSKESVYLVFEYMEYDLAALVSHPSVKFDIPHVKYLLLEILRAMAYLHQNQILHRDTKGSNVLINKKGELRLADFGLARSFTRHPREHMTNRVITLWYRPPELLLGSSSYGNEIDIWSIGCLFLEWMTGNAPFQGNTEINQLDAIYRVLGTPDYNNIDPQCPTLSSTKICPWFPWIKPKETYPCNLDSLISSSHCKLSSAGRNLVESLLAIEPAKRVSAEDALKHSFFVEDPKPCNPSEIPLVEGDWHEFEVKQNRRKKTQTPMSTSYSTSVKTPVNKIGGTPMLSLDGSGNDRYATGQ